MFKIGDFSRLSRVSVRALRLYDQIGLLKPVHVDQLTGYRYYSAEQLSRLNQIMAFKDLGFSLEQIAELLHDQIPTTQIRGMLHLRQAEVQQLIASEQTRLAQIEARLQQLEDDSTVAYDIMLKQVKAQKVAAIREVLPTCSQIKQLHTELEHYLQTQQVEIVGFPQALWHDAEYRLNDVDAEAVIPINQCCFEIDRVVAYTLSEVEQMACVIHRGSYAQVIQAYNALLKWIERHNYQVAGSNREVYLHPKRNSTELTETIDPAIAGSIVEIQFPVCHA